METRDMVRMVNQMADFFKSYSEQEAVEGIADHLTKFWDPGLRREFFAHVDKGGDGFNSLVIQAAALMKRPQQV